MIKKCAAIMVSVILCFASLTSTLAQNYERIFDNYLYAADSNIWEINNELFESFIVFLDNEGFTPYTQSRRSENYIFNERSGISPVQIDALMTLNEMGIRNVEAWLEETLIETSPGLMVFDFETQSEFIVSYDGSIMTTMDTNQLSLETKILRQKLLSPWSIYLPDVTDIVNQVTNNGEYELTDDLINKVHGYIVNINDYNAIDFEFDYMSIITPMNIDPRLQLVNNVNIHPYHAIVRILVESNRGTFHEATGFIIRNPRTGGSVVLTAGHNLYNPVGLGGMTRSLSITPAGGGPVHRHRNIAVDQRFRATQNSDYDLGAVGLQNFSPSFLPYVMTRNNLNIPVTSGGIVNGNVPIMYAGFPFSQVANPGFLHRTTGSIALFVNDRRRLVSSTAGNPGMSGSPVMRTSSIPYVIGILIGGVGSSGDAASVTICDSFFNNVALIM
ncbi:MAG: hypothetical protein FWC71_11685 [Defluviitaleaceae bacterium]|nr:hypothetical protein [Defluviitaleaceae bacterium]